MPLLPATLGLRLRNHLARRTQRWRKGPQTCVECPTRTCFGMSRAVRLWSGSVPDLVLSRLCMSVVFVAVHPVHLLSMAD